VQVDIDSTDNEEEISKKRYGEDVWMGDGGEGIECLTRRL